MGWAADEYHTHVFTTPGGARYRKPHDGRFDPAAGDDSALTVADALPGAGAKLEWRYDLGDGWEHEITAHSIVPAVCSVGIFCLGGGGRCPPGDCGGGGGGGSPTTPP